MSSRNVGIVRRIYEIFDEPDVEWPEFLDSDVVFVNPRDAVDPGIRRGHEGFARAMDSLRESFESFSHTPQRLLDRGEHVVVPITFRARGRGSGVEIEHEETHMWTLRDRKVIRFEWFRDLRSALEAVDAKQRSSSPG